MPLTSMTGFSRRTGSAGSASWSWELKSVNGKSFDLRLRLPPGWDAIEPLVRKRAGEALTRGTVYANLSIERPQRGATLRVNEQALEEVLFAMATIAGRVEAQPPSLDGILAIKGVMDVVEATETEDERRATEAAVMAGFAEALAELLAMRRHEGEALGAVLEARLSDIETLTRQADASPGRTAEAVQARLAAQIAALMGTGHRFEPERLHQEAILIASRADIREELDRLAAHVQQVRALLASGGAVGRRLDFLAQEFNREANTLCSKSNDVELTRIGVSLKVVVEQFREQVQNLE